MVSVDGFITVVQYGYVLYRLSLIMEMMSLPLP